MHSLAALLLISTATPQPLPDGVRAMIDAAVKSGDAKAVETVAKLARETHPDASAEIAGLHDAFKAKTAAKAAEEQQRKQEELATADIFEIWDGQVEFGASRSTGNTRNLGLYGALGVNREGLKWRHKVTARAEVQETNGNSTAERVVAAWQPFYKYHERFYAYGITEYEYDRFQGYDGRYTLGGGIGYTAIASDKARVEFEGGPAVRYVDEMSGDEHTTIAARASVNLRWKISPTLEFKQNSSLYYEPGDSSANALSALDAQLFGPVKARFSYDVRYESDVPAWASTINTQSRATLVYGF